MNHIIKLLFLTLLYITNVYAIGAPPEVLALEASFQSIPGISGAGVSKHHFSKEEVAQLNSIYFGGEYADLPIAMYRRSGGNLPNEILVSIEFTIDRNQTGLNALEFLSWWVRDLSRSGQNLQIRSIGLPPMAGENIQLGKTLRFWCEAYIVTEKEDMASVLNEVGALAKSLNSSIMLYDGALK